jgi:hypothetical protein
MNNWSNTNLWYNSSGSSPWGVTYPNWDNIINTTGTGVNTTPSITIPNTITVYPQPAGPYQTEIDWEAIRRTMDEQLARRGGFEPNIPQQKPNVKKVVPRKPLRMIRLREDAKVS